MTYKVSSYYDGADRARHRLGRPGDRRAMAGGGAARVRPRPHQPAPGGDRRRAALVRSPTSSARRQGWDALNRGDLDDGAVAYIHPDVEWRRPWARAVSRARSTAGEEAYERWLREELPEVWEEFHGEDLEFTRAARTGACCCSGTAVAPRARRAAREVRVPFGQLGRFARRPGGRAPRLPGPRERARRPAGLERPERCLCNA